MIKRSGGRLSGERGRPAAGRLKLVAHAGGDGGQRAVLRGMGLSVGVSVGASVGCSEDAVRDAVRDSV